MRTAVKICGVSTDDALQACIEAGVDWVGFVFFARSPRCVTHAQAARLAARLPGTIKPVGLFVDPADAEIDAALASVDLAALQIYGAADRVAALRTRTGRPAWHALPVGTAADLPSITAVDRLVIEGRTRGTDRPGGNGARFDWSLLASWTPPVPWLLAGGLTPDNVGEAIGITGATAVDVSSGVESIPGVKDPSAIAAFVRSARKAEKPGADHPARFQ